MTYDPQFDFNNADSQREFSLIPEDTVCPLRLTLRPGGVGDGGWLKLTKAGDKQMLDCEIVVTDGPFAKRKFWTMMVVEGSEDAANISRSTLRAILESSRNIKPDDASDAAKRARLVSGYGDFDGIEFVGKVGIEPGQNGYKDKNRLKAVVTPGMTGYAQAPTTQAAPAQQWSGPPPAAQQTSGPTPAWAQ